MTTRYVPIIGERHFRYVILDIFRKQIKKQKYLYVTAQCDCGVIKEVMFSSLRLGKTKSCGCLKNEKAAQSCRNRSTHSSSKTKFYMRYAAMLNRCSNPNHPQYKDYGGRGIRVCEEWKNFETFYNWAISNGFEEGLTIDRIDNEKGYYPENCRWTTKENQSNNKRSNVRIEIFGESKTVSQWSRDERCKTSEWNFWYRVKNGWTPEEALITPTRPLVKSAKPST